MQLIYIQAGLLLSFASSVQAQNSSDGGIPPWLAYVTGGILFVTVFYYCCRKNNFDENLSQPLLGGMYNEDGQAITRQDVRESINEGSQGAWKCDVCDFLNKPTAKSCILCGTEEDFKLGIIPSSPQVLCKSDSISSIASNDEKKLKKEPSFNRQRSFAIRRLNMLNSRQRGARNRLNWVRKVDDNGKRYWSRNNPNTTTEASITSQSSLAFVSTFASTPNHPDGHMVFQDVKNVDASLSSRGYEISAEDLEVLEEVAAYPFKDKYQWFLQQTASLIKPWEDGHLKMRLNRDNVLVESMEQLLGVQMDHIHMPLRIEFIGEAGIDAGGIEREWFELVAQTVFDDTIGLFILTHVDQLSYTINQNSQEASVDHLLYYRGVGRLLGRALLEGQLMKAHLALPLLKHFLGVPISFSDLEFVDYDIYKNLKYVRDNSGVENLCLDFSINNRKLNGDIEIIDLKPNGRNIEVTDDNKHEYIQLYLQYVMLDSYKDQLQHLMAGLFEVIPQELILVFDYQELELVLCGVPSINMDDWKNYTQTSDDLPEYLLDWFWEIIDSYTDDEKARLLQFTTGSSRVPVQGFKALTSYDGRICHFTLKAVPYPENAYPRAHTCFNRIDLPLYTEKEQLEEVLSLVINMEVTGFTDE